MAQRCSCMSALPVALLSALMAVPVPLLSQGWTPELTIQVKRVSDVMPSPDGTWIAFQVAGPVMEGETSERLTQIHVAGSDGQGSRQLTWGEASSTSPAWSPDGEWIGFLSDRGEGVEVWRIPLQGGEARPITDVPEDVGAFSWSPSGDRIGYLMRDPETEEEEKAKREKRDARVVDENLKMIGLYVADVSDSPTESRRLSPGRVSVQSWTGRRMDWSPDGSTIVFVHQPSPKVNDWPKADLSAVDVATGRVRALASTGAAEGSPHFSPDGRWIAFAASDDPASWAFTWDVYVVPSEGGEPLPLSRTFDRQASVLGWRADGSAVLVSEPYRTLRRIQALPIDASGPLDLSPAELLVNGPTLNRAATHLGFVSETPDKPPEAYVAGLPGFDVSQVSRLQELPEVPLGPTEVVSWESTNGYTIEGLLTYPVGYRAGERVPLLVLVHGGPTGMFSQSFIGNPGQYPVAVFASRGYAVLRPNPRGGSGYGREFRYANYGDWGGGDYGDIMSGVDAMIDRGVADPDRLGVMGWSYGGFMTSWIVTQTDRFRAASIGAALPNLVSFAGTSDVPDFVPDYFGGDFWERTDAWLKHAPMFHVGGVTTPSLIQHGERDERVPVSQAYELYNALKRQGVETKLVIYPRQPHGIREPKLLLDAMERNLEWFARWIRPQTVSVRERGRR